MYIRKTGAVFHFSRNRLDGDAITQQYLGVDELNKWNHNHSTSCHRELIPSVFGRNMLGEIHLSSIGNRTSDQFLG